VLLDPILITIRKATVEDVPLILSFIRELAEYERNPNAVVATEEGLRRDGFSETPRFHVLIAEYNDNPAGMLFYFYNYSTWQGCAGIFVEDLWVRPDYRKKRIGKSLMSKIAQIAISERLYGMRWEVLDWNKLAIDFYHGIGAKFREHWRVMQLMRPELEKLAKSL
jgi:GNAT superfamily N-acetyltransferase